MKATPSGMLRGQCLPSGRPAIAYLNQALPTALIPSQRSSPLLDRVGRVASRGLVGWGYHKGSLSTWLVANESLARCVKYLNAARRRAATRAVPGTFTPTRLAFGQPPSPLRASNARDRRGRDKKEVRAAYALCAIALGHAGRGQPNHRSCVAARATTARSGGPRHMTARHIGPNKQTAVSGFRRRPTTMPEACAATVVKITWEDRHAWRRHRCPASASSSAAPRSVRAT